MTVLWRWVSVGDAIRTRPDAARGLRGASGRACTRGVVVHGPSPPARSRPSVGGPELASGLRRVPGKRKGAGKPRWDQKCRVADDDWGAGGRWGGNGNREGWGRRSGGVRGWVRGRRRAHTHRPALPKASGPQAARADTRRTQRRRLRLPPALPRPFPSSTATPRVPP